MIPAIQFTACPMVSGVTNFDHSLMGELKIFPRGQAIVRQGESGNEMFVLIGGKAEVQVTVNGHSRVVRELAIRRKLVRALLLRGRSISSRPTLTIRHGSRPRLRGLTRSSTRCSSTVTRCCVTINARRTSLRPRRSRS
jgi:hypothetical protein